MIGTCPLCRQMHRELAPSALPPAQLLLDPHARAGEVPFQFTAYARPLIEPSANGFASNLHLCTACRQQLLTWERRAARDIMAPIAAGAPVLPAVAYDWWLARLAASLAWRVLAAATHAGNRLTAPELRADIMAAMEAWRAFAAGSHGDPGGFDLHMLPIGNLEEAGDQRWYVREVVHLEAILTRTADALVWMKLPGVLLLGVIKAGLGSLSVDSRVHVGGPALWSPEVYIPGIVRFLQFEELRRTLLAWHSVPQASLSERQG